MKMQINIYICGLLLLIMLSCHSIKKNLTSKKSNFIKLNDEVFLSKYEVTNRAYKLYLEYLRSNFSEKIMEEYLPDSASLYFIQEANTYYSMPYYSKYFEHPVFDDFPVIGIDYEQAIDYCKWKTEQEKINGNRNKIIQFRLPTIKEWNKASQGEPFLIGKKNGIYYPSVYIPKKVKDSLSIKGKAQSTFFNVNDKSKLIHKNKIVTYDRDNPNIYEGKQPQPKAVFDVLKNEKGFIHMYDNVSEMTNEKGIAKGANFLSKYDDIELTREIKYTKPEPWLGFRLVMELEN